MQILLLTKSVLTNQFIVANYLKRGRGVAHSFTATPSCWRTCSFFFGGLWLYQIQYQPVSTSKTIADDAGIDVVEQIIANCTPAFQN